MHIHPASSTTPPPGLSPEPATFGARNFGACQLGHRRRTRRLVQLADALLDHPEGPLTHKLQQPAAYRALCRLANQPAVTHQAVLRGPTQATLDALRARPGVSLLLHDTTELDFSGRTTLAALGPIGNGRGQGYECHNSLAIDPATGRLLGLAHQILHTRRDVPPGEGVAAKRADPQRESRLWVRAVAAIGPAPAGALWVDVCDRGADTFEFLEYERRHDRAFVIRSTHSRALELDEGDDGPHRLHDRLRGLAPAARWEVGVAAQPGQPARTAAVQAAWAAVRLRAPRVRRGEHGRAALAVWAIRVWEPCPPAGVEPLEWVLLTAVPVATVADLRERVAWYEWRPLIEDYHKAQKTGAGIEGLRFQSQAGLEPVIALLSVVAVELVNLRVAARVPGQAERPAAEVVDPLCVEVLSVWRYGEARPLSVREYTLALGRLGGHQNRTGDGLPGWQTLWRGWNQLHAMTSYELSRRSCSKH
jgi:Transposase DNA-binding